MKIQDISNNTQGVRPTREQLNEWLKSQVLCSLATLDDYGAPMVATVAFTVMKNGELLVGTSEDSRKSRNLDTDARVAMVVTDENARMTVQLEGTATKISEAEFLREYADEHYTQRPESLPFRDKPGQCHILVSPAHIRFSDVSVYPWVITEFTV